MKKLLIIILILLSASFVNAATLLFSSGFEDASALWINPALPDNWPKFRSEGIDAETGYDWEDFSSTMSFVRTDYLTGMYNFSAATWGVHCLAEITTDPDDAGNEVLHFIHYNDPAGDNGRLQLSFLMNMSEITGWTEGYFKYRMRLSDMLVFENSENVVDWLVIVEQFSHSAVETAASRWGLSIHKDWGVGEEMYWHLKGEAPILTSIWSHKVTRAAVPIPIETWFTLEVYAKKGDDTTGRVVIWITPDGGSRTELFNITEYTESPYIASYAEDWQIFKLYSEGGTVGYAADQGEPLQIWYDDFEYWDTYDFSEPSTESGYININ